MIAQWQSGAPTNSSGNILNAFDGTLLAVLGLPLVALFLIMIYRHYSRRYTIDNDNVESRHGVIAREVTSIRLVDIRNITVKQSLFDRILFIGDIEIGSAGTADIEVVFQRVGRPVAVKRKIQNLQ